MKSSIAAEYVGRKAVSGAAEKRKRAGKSVINRAKSAACGTHCTEISGCAGRYGRSDLHWNHRTDQAVSTYNLEKGSRLGTYAARCIENELLMYFRSKKKTARDVSLYEPIGTDKEGNQIKLLDIVESGEPELWERVVEKKNILRFIRTAAEGAG